jgi:hypothetical protein
MSRCDEGLTERKTAMLAPWEKKIDEFVAEIPRLLGNFSYRKGPELYFYRKTMELRRRKGLGELFEDESERFIELIYATLVAWDMNSRGAKMKYFDQFKSSILASKERFMQLSSSRLEMLSNATVGEVKMLLRQIYYNMHVMESRGRLVSNSKVMHFILPDLVMPMDRRNTLAFFFGNMNESEDYFLRIFGQSLEIARKIDLRQFLDEEWNLSVPKVIDNAIISKMSPKYDK